MDKNILHIADLYDEDVKTRKTAEDLNVSWLQLNTVWECIPKVWKLFLKDDMFGEYCDRYDLWSKCKNRNRYVYDMLNYDDNLFLK